MPGVAEVMKSTQDSMTVRRVFGDPVEREGLTLIPVASISGGGGGGEGTEGQQQGTGAGFGVRARPVGAYVVRRDEVLWQPAFDIMRVIMGGLAFAALATVVFGTRRRRAISD